MKIDDTKYWLGELDRYRKTYENWQKNGQRIVDRYRLEAKMKRGSDGESGGHASSSYNVLWSIVQTMKPSLFSRAPAVVAERRHKDKDPVARVAAEVIERGTSYQIEFSEFADAMNDAVLDVLLVARGVPWVIFEADEKPDMSVARYEDPKDKSEGFMTGAGDSVKERKRLYHGTSGSDVSDDEDLAESDDLMTRQDGFSDQRIMVDYVHWKDFAHAPLAKWRAIEKRGWVARRVTMTRAEGIERFGEEFAKVELSAAMHESDDTERDREASDKKMAAVWEIWDAKSKKRIHISKGLEKALEVKDDPYTLEKFFPCPRPAYATLTNEDMVPVPDYLQYVELAEELDVLSARIRKLTESLKACGAYDGSIEGIGRLMSLDDGQLVAVSGMQAVTAKGGLNNAIQWMPISGDRAGHHLARRTARTPEGPALRRVRRLRHREGPSRPAGESLAIEDQGAIRAEQD